MTQRRAVFVGCRLIAVYMVMEAAASVFASMATVGWMSTINGGRAGAGMGAGGMTGYIIQGMVVPAVARGGLAVFLWALAGAVARAAATPEDGDDV